MEPQPDPAVAPGAPELRLPRLALLGVVAAWLAQVPLWWGQLNDDAFITFRYSLNVARGVGPFYNPGEAVEGYTNMLLMWLLAAVAWIGGAEAVLPAARAVGIVSGVAMLFGAWWLARRLARGLPGVSAEWAGVVAAALLAASPELHVNATHGLETTLFAALVLAGLVRMVQATDVEGADLGRWNGAGVFWALAVWTRPEGPAVYAAAWIGWVVARELRRRAAGGGSPWRALRPAVLDGAVVVGAFVLQLAFRLATYGEWLPNTYYAKQGGFWTAPSTYVVEGVVDPVGGPVVAGLALVGLLVCVVPRVPSTIPVVTAGAFASCLPFLTGTDWMLGHRLSIPARPMVVVAVTLGGLGLVAEVLRRLDGRSAPRTVGVAGLGAAVVWTVVLQAGALGAALRHHVDLRARGYETGHRQVAEHVRARAVAGDTVALMDIGIVGYECIEQRILDVTGLTDRFIAHSPGGFLTKTFDPGYVLDQEPRFVVLTVRFDGEPYGEPAGRSWRFWTDIERSLYEDPRFVAHYLRRRDVPPAARRSDDWKDRFAPFLGADLLVEHGHPGLIYLLAVFERNGA